MHIALRLTVIATAALAIQSPLMAQDADLIDGFRTNDFARFFPDGDDAPSGYRQSGLDTDPSLHLATADYDAEDGASFANVRVIAWPPNSPEPIADGDTDMVEQSIDGARAMMEEEGFEDATRVVFSTEDGGDVECLLTEQNPQAEFIYCATIIKGRIMEIQHFASIEARDNEARRDVAEAFVGELVDHMIAAE